MTAMNVRTEDIIQKTYYWKEKIKFQFSESPAKTV